MLTLFENPPSEQCSGSASRWCGSGSYLSIWLWIQILPLSYSTSRFWASNAPKWPSKASTFSLWCGSGWDPAFHFDAVLLSTSMRIRIQLPKMMRIRIHNTVSQCFGSVFIFSGSGSRGWGWTPIRIRIRIQSGSRALMTKNWKKKKLQLKKKLNFFLSKTAIYLSKTAIYLSLGLHKVCPSYRRSLQLTKEAIQHFKTWTLKKKNSTFVGHFCPPGSGSGFRIRIRIHWPDWIRIRIRNPAVSGIVLNWLLVLIR